MMYRQKTTRLVGQSLEADMAVHEEKWVGLLSLLKLAEILNLWDLLKTQRLEAILLPC